MSTSRDKIERAEQIIFGNEPVSEKIDVAATLLDDALRELNAKLEAIPLHLQVTSSLVSSGFTKILDHLQKDELNRATMLGQVARIYFLQGCLCRMQGQHEQAGAKLNLALKHYELSYPGGHIDVVRIHNNIALIHIAQDNRAAAEQQLRRALDEAQKLHAELNDYLHETYENLCMVLQAEGKETEAQEYRKKYAAMTGSIIKPDPKSVPAPVKTRAVPVLPAAKHQAMVLKKPKSGFPYARFGLGTAAITAAVGLFYVIRSRNSDSDFVPLDWVSKLKWK